ncbi:MAG: hypothetical protein VYC39_10675 [Myxococcota bacterium]|nr:hypothetical protein [Myxococcota bacterium]
MHKLSVHKIPSVSSEAVAKAQKTLPSKRGFVAVAHPSSHDQMIYFDVNQQELGVLTIHNSEKIATHRIDCYQDPITPGPLAVDQEGKRVLLMSRAARFTDSRLLEVNLITGEQITHYQHAGPGWLMGQFVKDEIIVFEQRLGEEPVFLVWRRDKTIWESRGTQPMVLPQIWSDPFILMLACTNPNPLTGSGPTQLCALDFRTGVIFPLASIEGERLSVDGNIIRVENRSHDAHDFELELNAD